MLVTTSIFGVAPSNFIGVYILITVEILIIDDFDVTNQSALDAGGYIKFEIFDSFFNGRLQRNL